MGAADEGSGVAARGMCPSPAKSPEVGSRPDPSSAGQIDLGPSVQVGEVLLRARVAFERLQIGLQLDQIAGDEAGGEAQMTQNFDQ